jgi:probable rRNA maturation factor
VTSPGSHLAAPGRAEARRIAIAPWRLDVTIRPGVPRLVASAVLARLVRATLARTGAPAPASIGLILSDDAELRLLNRRTFGRRRPTDVLSFPLLPASFFPPHEDGPGSGGAGEDDDVTDRLAAPPFVLPPRVRPHLGDIVVSVERAAAQAREGRGGHDGSLRWAPGDELRLLVIHGTLHVCGWDHAEAAEAAAMRSLEEQLLAGGARP